MLGTAKQVIISKDDTIIMDGAGSKYNPLLFYLYSLGKLLKKDVNKSENKSSLPPLNTTRKSSKKDLPS